MAGSVNKVILVGNLGRDPEVRTTQAGSKIVNLAVATSESWTDKASGERKEQTEWNRIVIMNDRLADVAEKYLHKGSKACAQCGNLFFKAKKISATQWEGQRFCSRVCGATKRSCSDADVRALYAYGKSSTEVSAVFGISGAHVIRILNKYGDIREPSVRLKLSHSRPEVKEKISNANTGRPCKEAVKAALRDRIGPLNHNWNGGKTITAGGYEYFTASPYNAENAQRGVHVVTAEKASGRRAEPGEHVHHLDHNKLNNDPSNLMIMSASDHSRYHATISGFGKRHVR